METSIGSPRLGVDNHDGPLLRVTLNHLISSLVAGGLCFCCGSALVPLIEDGRRRSFGCLACGAAVDTETDLALAHAA